MNIECRRDGVAGPLAFVIHYSLFSIRHSPLLGGPGAPAAGRIGKTVYWTLGVADNSMTAELLCAET